MRWFWKTSIFLLSGALLLVSTPIAIAQKSAMPKAPAQPAAQASAPRPQTAAPAAPGQQPRQRIVIIEPVRVFDPFFDYPYLYAYAPDYMAENFGYVKIKTEYKDASVYLDGGFAGAFDEREIKVR